LIFLLCANVRHVSVYCIRELCLCIIARAGRQKKTDLES
jgi:hypothetical protein